MTTEKKKSSSFEPLQTNSKKTNKAFTLATTGVLAGVYAAVTIAFGTISYGPLNLRFSNVLIAVVPIVGWPGVFGISLGVFLGNINSFLGPIDLVSALFSLLALSILKLIAKRSVLAGLAIYSLILSLWVTFELSVVTRAPYFPTFYGVLGGIALIVVGLAYPIHRALKSSGMLGRFKSVNT